MKLDYESPPDPEPLPPRGRRHPAEIPVAIVLWFVIGALLWWLFGGCGLFNR